MSASRKGSKTTRQKIVVSQQRIECDSSQSTSQLRDQFEILKRVKRSGAAHDQESWARTFGNRKSSGVARRNAGETQRAQARAEGAQAPWPGSALRQRARRRRSTFELHCRYRCA